MPVAAPAQPAQAGNPKAAPAAPWPFPVGVFDEEIQNAYDQTLTATTGTKQFADIEVEPEGWLRGLWFDFGLVAVNATSNTVAFAEDGPFNSVNTVLLKGTNVPQTFGPFGGYDWENVNKFGAYQPCGDPRADQGYSVTSGTATTAGSANWQLYMPMEISAHDALGDLQNQSDNSVYRVALTLESTATIYTTAPTGAVTCRVRVEQDSYSEPVAALALGGRPMMDAPPLPGTRQCWQQEDDASIPAASHTTKITNGIGYAYRSIIFKLMRAGTSRANGESDYPDPFEVWLGGTRTKRLESNLWKTKLGRRYRWISTTADSANGPENGVRVLNYNQDVNMAPGNDARRKLLRTQDGNVFKVIGTYGHAGTLWITSNYVIPRGGPQANAQVVK
jgi:hypothetical protein